MKRVNDLRWKLFGYAGTALIMMVIFAMFSLTAFAAEGKVTASAAKIRKDASTSSEAVGSATNGQTFTIVGEKTGSDGKVWYQISFDGNKTGYIRSDLMKKTEEAGNTGDTGNAGGSENTGTVAPTVPVEQLQPVSATITGGTVRVRSDATTEGSTILANIVKDSVVTVTGRATDSQNKTWYLVSFSSDSGEVQGFIREDFLTVSGTITPIVDTPPAEENPPAEEPGEEEPAPKPPVVTEKYYIQEDAGEWFLVDKDAGVRYNAESLIKAAINNPEVFAEKEKTIKSQKGWIVVLVFLVAILGIAAVLLFLKMREVMDDAYFAAIEKETIRQRQGQKANNPSNANKSVMHTVGANGNKTGTAQKPGAPKPANTRPVNAKPSGQQQKPAGTGVPQTVKVSNPAETRVQKPATAQQKPVNPQNKPVNNSQAKPVQQKPVENPSKQNWQSKNFALDEDDEFEFEFLNWDGSDDE